VINPADLSNLKGKYGNSAKLPLVPGLEGSGVIVESNAGILGWSLTGKRVACAILG